MRTSPRAAAGVLLLLACACAAAQAQALSRIACQGRTPASLVDLQAKGVDGAIEVVWQPVYCAKTYRVTIKRTDVENVNVLAMEVSVPRVVSKGVAIGSPHSVTVQACNGQLCGPKATLNNIVPTGDVPPTLTTIDDEFGAAQGGCGPGVYWKDGTGCTPCTRVGCSDCRTCQMTDPMGSCGPNNDQYCVGMCLYGYYTDNRGSCWPCRPECTDCQACQGRPNCSGGYCTACKFGLALVNGQCVPANQCPNGCATCQGTTCLSCIAPLRLFNGRCISRLPCPPGCTYCSADGKWCTSCLPGLALRSGKCTAPSQCPIGCARCNGAFCTACYSGFFPVPLVPGTCAACSSAVPGCARCQLCTPAEIGKPFCNSGVKCMGCIQNWVLSGDGRQRCKPAARPAGK